MQPILLISIIAVTVVFSQVSISKEFLDQEKPSKMERHKKKQFWSNSFRQSPSSKR